MYYYIVIAVIFLLLINLRVKTIPVQESCSLFANDIINNFFSSIEYPKILIFCCFFRYFCMEQCRQFRYIALELCVATLQVSRATRGAILHCTSAATRGRHCTSAATRARHCTSAQHVADIAHPPQHVVDMQRAQYTCVFCFVRFSMAAILNTVNGSWPVFLKKFFYLLGFSHIKCSIYII